MLQVDHERSIEQRGQLTCPTMRLPSKDQVLATESSGLKWVRRSATGLAIGRVVTWVVRQLEVTRHKTSPALQIRAPWLVIACLPSGAVDAAKLDMIAVA